MGIIWTIIIGFVAGLIAKWIMPGKNEPSGFILTTILGIVGAIVGGFIGTRVFGFGDIDGFDLRSMAIAVGGALLVLFVYGLTTRGRS
jgi:uncharacterized membrane protein YeaQ/YmgE (transglycosylase-associated protein family)